MTGRVFCLALKVVESVHVAHEPHFWVSSNILIYIYTYTHTHTHTHTHIHICDIIMYIDSYKFLGRKYASNKNTEK